MPIILPETSIAVNLPDGVYPYDGGSDHYCVILNGEIVNYATHESTAYHQFTEACRVRREHLRNNAMETN